MTSDSLKTYLNGFANAAQAWPPLPLPEEPELAWWQAAIGNSADGVLRGQAVLDALLPALPQLQLPQVEGISSSDLYRAMVLRGEKPDTPELSEQQRQIGPVPQWREADALELWIAPHPCGALPVLQTPSWHDFAVLVRALAHRAEPVTLPDGVHAQAISGLIHWGLIHQLGRQSRARMIVLHRAPYGSVGAEHVPGSPTEADWLCASTTLRLEHELTHLATKRLLGDMRLNLLDELIADCMGMVAALGGFDAALFGRCLGLDERDEPIANGRWLSYTRELSDEEARAALTLVMARARELGAQLQSQPLLLQAEQAMVRLQWLCQQRLDQPISPAPAIRQ